MRQFAVAFALTFGAANAVAGQAVSLAGALHIDPDAVKKWEWGDGFAPAQRSGFFASC